MQVIINTTLIVTLTPKIISNMMIGLYFFIVSLIRFFALLKIEGIIWMNFIK